jgi:hypothetical protein
MEIAGPFLLRALVGPTWLLVRRLGFGHLVWALAGQKGARSYTRRGNDRLPCPKR